MKRLHCFLQIMQIKLTSDISLLLNHFRQPDTFFISVHSVEPDYIREGGTLPLVLTLTETTGKDCVFLPMGRSVYSWNRFDQSITIG